ncbi:hypothetical protein FEB19_23200 [Salmonella enterica]|nr:hypothetical protein [Salmonella enterica]EAS1561949.1 hypothetical protein [Salmonella enterica]EBI1098245.1 hypothetical protein [Salmonella enterica]EBJ7046186.1 hypothetical protein [Salmonella enterica]EBN5509154.1 hypothetical protein [Salmonella enterica]
MVIKMRVRKSIADINNMRLLRLKFDRLLNDIDGNGCINWSGPINFNGYGQFSFEGRSWLSHRLAYEIANGAIPGDAEKWWVLHKCDNPACCNPDHLYLGDAKDNAKDMIDRKRQRMGFKRHGWGESTRFGRVFYEINGEIKTIFEWAEFFDVNPCTLEQRIAAGWPAKDLGLSPKAYKRHLKSDGKTRYKRFSGLKEVEDYKNEASVAATNEASISTNHRRNDDMNIVAKSDYNFHGVNLIPVKDVAGIWLTSADIAKALGYKSTKSISNLFTQYEDEFSQGMTMVIESVTNGINGSTRRMKVRVFSLRGAHLIAMFARTPVAKEFRRWVLDILDREVDSSGADRLPTKFHQRVMLYLDTKGDIINTYPLNKDQVVMSFDAFVSYFRKKGWIVAPRDEVAKGIMGAIQVLS